MPKKCLYLFSLFSLLFFSHPSLAGEVFVTVTWSYKGDLPPIKIYEANDPKSLALWVTQSVKTWEEVPVAEEIKHSTLLLGPGSKKTFVLVMKNTTGKKIRFFATPHQATPVESTLGFKFHCLCINHIFEVGPGEYWYRVVEFFLSPDYVGSKLFINHTLVEVDQHRKIPNMMGAEHK